VALFARTMKVHQQPTWLVPECLSYTLLYVGLTYFEVSVIPTEGSSARTRWLQFGQNLALR
jgi:hypothetical protein